MGKRKSPPLLLAIILVLERFVTNKLQCYPTYLRLYAWTRLIRHWAALRWSDLLFAPPRLAKFSDEGITIVITQTKTTGVGKKVEVLHAYVGSGAFLQESDWLRVGWILFQEANVGNLERDFWLPLPDRGLGGFSAKEPRCSDAVAMSRKVFQSPGGFRSARRIRSVMLVSFYRL